jgi:hypothetical protein
MAYAFNRNPEAESLKRWSIEQVDRQRKHLLELPTGDFIHPYYVDMVRCSSSKADRATGEVGAVVHVECKGSWFSVRFDEVDEARSFARALVDFRDGWHI